MQTSPEHTSTCIYIHVHVHLHVCYMSVLYPSVLSFLPTSERYLATDFKQLAAPPEMPEWKRVSFGGVKASYGKKTQLTILEQRQGLPIYKLRENLVQVRICYLECALYRQYLSVGHSMYNMHM